MRRPRIHVHATPHVDRTLVEQQMAAARRIYGPFGVEPCFEWHPPLHLPLEEGQPAGQGANALVDLDLSARWPWHPEHRRFRRVRRFLRERTAGQRSAVIYLFGLKRRDGIPEIAVTGGPTGSMRRTWISHLGARAPYERTLAHELGHQWGQHYHSLRRDNLMSAAALPDGTLSERLTPWQVNLRMRIPDRN